MQIEHFIRLRFGPDDSDEVFFFVSCPRPQSSHTGQDKREILEGCFLARFP
jgi:hypothetical protein